MRTIPLSELHIPDEVKARYKFFTGVDYVIISNDVMPQRIKSLFQKLFTDGICYPVLTVNYEDHDCSTNIFIFLNVSRIQYEKGGSGEEFFIRLKQL